MNRSPRFVILSVIFLMMGSLLFLSGCGDDGNGTSGESTPLAFYKAVEADDFIIQIPEDWEIITQFSSNYPDNTVAAFRNNIKDHDFIANLNVVRNAVAEGTDSGDYAIDLFKTISSQMVNFKKIHQEEYTLSSSDGPVSTYLFEFEGTNEATNANRQFIQVYAVVGTEAYIVTGTYDENDTELAIDQVEQSVRSFELK